MRVRLRLCVECDAVGDHCNIFRVGKPIRIFRYFLSHTGGDKAHRPVFTAGVPQKTDLRLADGLGLGLSLARGLAELHGGSLLVESTPGKGCQAHLRLPLTGENPLPRPHQFRTPPRPYRANGLELFRVELSTALPWEHYSENLMD